MKMLTSNKIFYLFLFTLIGRYAYSGEGKLSGNTEVDKPLKVVGQTRNVSMLLTFKNKKDKIEFPPIRENYKKEISRTRW